MKTYPIILTPRKIDTLPIEEKTYEINNQLDELKIEMKEKFQNKIDFSIKEKVELLSSKIDAIIKNLQSLNNINFQKECEFNPQNINKKCFKIPEYFHKYIYFAILENNLPDIKTILAYGDYKTFNDVGVYFYNQTYLKKAEIFLNKAYILAENKSIPAHNLSVLYATKGIYNIKKSIKYAKEANLPIDNYNIGICYYIGLGVKEDDKKAREYFKKADNINFAKQNLEIMNKFNIGK
jgi:hypothetical protein